MLGEAAPLGLLLALVGSLSPPSVVAVGGLVAGLLVGAVVLGGLAAIWRATVVAAASLAIAVGCCLPWSLGFLSPGARWSVLGGAVGGPGSAVSLARLLRFAAGPIGGGFVGWGLVLAAGYVLFVAQGPRLSWAGRWWIAALAVVALAYAGSIGWLGSGGGATLVLVAPAAACLAAAVGLGVAAFEIDLTRSRFGWRQSVSAGAVLLLCAGVLPVVVSMASGRSGLPAIGYDQVLGWTSPTSATQPYGVLWLGEPATIPAPAWQLHRGEAMAVSVDGLPDGRRLWPSSDPGVGNAVATAIERAQSGLTIRLGAQLALAGVRYVVLPTAVGPYLPGEQTPERLTPSAALVAALRAQVDLRQLPTEGGVIAFENVEWPVPAAGAPVPALAVQPAGVPGWLRSIGVLAGLAIVVATSAVVLRRRRRRTAAPADLAPSDEVAAS